MNDASFVARLQAHLDARRDPLDDGELAAYAAEHPEWLERLAGMRADARDLAALAPTATAPRRRRRTRPLAAAITAAALVAVALQTGAGRPSATAAAPAGRILAASLTELRPRAHVTAGATATESVLTTAACSLATWTSWRERR